VDHRAARIDRRRTFGRPIRKFQAVSFMIARAQTLLAA
jgi:hypothetical protein